MTKSLRILISIIVACTSSVVVYTMLQKPQCIDGFLDTPSGCIIGANIGAPLISFAVFVVFLFGEYYILGKSFRKRESSGLIEK